MEHVASKTPVTSLLAFITALILPLSAQCFYNPSTGRWLSRDSIEESAFAQQRTRSLEIHDLQAEALTGLSPYALLKNDAVSFQDMDGCRMTPDGEVAITDKNRRKAPGKMQLITVSKCTILFVYGHNFVNNFEKEGLQWIWNIVPGKDSEKQCSYAA